MQIDLDVNALAKRPVEQVRHALDEVGTVHPLRKQGFGAGERQQASRQRGCARCALHRIVEMVEHLATRSVEAAACEVDTTHDDGEHIVEVVGDSTGELADGFHLLDLAKLCLGRLPFLRFGLQCPIRFG